MSVPSAVSFKGVLPADLSTLDARAKLAVRCESGPCNAESAFSVYNYISGGLYSVFEGAFEPYRDILDHPVSVSDNENDFFQGNDAMQSVDFFVGSRDYGLQGEFIWVDLGSYFWWSIPLAEDDRAFISAPWLDFFVEASPLEQEDVFVEADALVPTDVFPSPVVQADVFDVFDGAYVSPGGGTIWDNGVTVWDDGGTIWDA